MKVTITLEDTERGVLAGTDTVMNGCCDNIELSIAFLVMTGLALQIKQGRDAGYLLVTDAENSHR